MSIWDLDAEPPKKIHSRVQHHLHLLENNTDFKVLNKSDDALLVNFNGGVAEVGIPIYSEFQSEALMKHSIVLRQLYVDIKKRNDGIGSKILKDITDAYKDTDAVLILYSTPIKLASYSLEPQLVDDIDVQKRLVMFYAKGGFSCLKHEHLYTVKHLCMLAHKYTFKHMLPMPMGLACNNASPEVQDVIKHCSITTEEAFKVMKRKKHIPDFTPTHLISQQYV